MRLKIVAALPKLSWGAFFATIILTPFRLHVVLLSRPVVPIWGDYTDLLLYASDIALILTVLPWLAQLWLQRRRPNLAPRFITLPLAGLTLLGGLSSFSSVDPALSAYHFVRLVLLFCFYLYVTNNVGTIQQLIAPVSAQIIIQAVVAIPQAIEQKSIGLQKLGEYLLDPAWKGVSVVLTQTSRTLRAYGLSDHPNILGGCLAFGLLLIFAFLIFNKSKRRQVFFLILAADSVALFYTYSRAAWLAALFGAVLILFLVFRRRKPDELKRSLFLGVLVLMLLVPFVLKNSELLGVRLGAGGSFQEISSEIGSIGERRVLISSGDTLFENHPVLGVGLGVVPEAFLANFPDFPVSYQPVHFVLLDVAVELGLLGAVLYFVLIVVPWVALYLQRNMKFSIDLIAASGLLLATMVVGLFDYYTWMLVPGRLWQWLAWGLWAAFYARATEKSRA
jgi:Ca2+/Na+ antiporter